MGALLVMGDMGWEAFNVLCVASGICGGVRSCPDLMVARRI